MESLGWLFLRPRQVRYQAALRPDMIALLILNHFHELAKTIRLARAGSCCTVAGLSSPRSMYPAVVLMRTRSRSRLRKYNSIPSAIPAAKTHNANMRAMVRTAHKNWYGELFQPCVTAGLIPAGALAGYRNDAVYLRTSRYVPPRWEAVRDAMPVLFDLLEREADPGVRAVLGHWLFGYIHPYPDGNGRMARFVMNAMLASGGFPWTVIRVEDRDAYLGALDRASIDADIAPFARFIADRVRWSIDQASEKSSGRAKG